MRRLLAAAAVTVLSACGRPTVDIVLVGDPNPSAIEIRGLPRGDIAALAGASLTREDWQQILRVQVTHAALEPIVGAYAAVDGAIRFTPMYGFDAGRSFSVTFDASRIPGANPRDAWRSPPQVATVGVAQTAVVRATTVRQIYPSGAEVPANLLRLYIEFSGPMGRDDGLKHIRLLDDSGSEITAPFLPVQAELWTADRTRFTLLFDPGRVKRGIKPNLDMGRALVQGRRYTLVIDSEWRDGVGQSLKTAYRHEFRVGRPIEKALDLNAWQITAPAPGSRNPLVVEFPWALDHGLLQRALGVRRDASEVPGDVTVAPGETRWSFTPRDNWKVGDYRLTVLTLLEDPAGNRLGRAFEVREETAPAGEAVYRSFALSTKH